MKRFTILSSESTLRGDSFGVKCLSRDVQAFYHEDYYGGSGRWNIDGTVENTICTIKNDITPYTESKLQIACSRLACILRAELPEVLRLTGRPTLRVCVIPRAKREEFYRANQLYLRATIQSVVQSLVGFEDGSHDIIRITDTKTTHRAKWGHGGEGRMPYAGITNDTCTLSDNIVGKDILLIDDLYTKTVNIDEDCLQALIEKGANNVYFYSIGRTASH